MLLYAHLRYADARRAAVAKAALSDVRTARARGDLRLGVVTFPDQSSRLRHAEMSSEAWTAERKYEEPRGHAVRERYLGLFGDPVRRGRQ